MTQMWKIFLGTTTLQSVKQDGITILNDDFQRENPIRIYIFG